mgnify:CR=1 FL=1
MARITFLRRITNRYKKLGGMGGKKKNLKWRRPRGRDNKMRDRRRGYRRTVTIGFGNKKNERGKIEGKQVIRIYNVKDLLNAIEKNGAIMLGKVGKKKRIEIAKIAKEKGVTILNLNEKKLLEEVK